MPKDIVESKFVSEYSKDKMFEGNLLDEKGKSSNILAIREKYVAGYLTFVY